MEQYTTLREQAYSRSVLVQKSELQPSGKRTQFKLHQLFPELSHVGVPIRLSASLSSSLV